MLGGVAGALKRVDEYWAKVKKYPNPRARTTQAQMIFGLARRQACGAKLTTPSSVCL